MEGILEPTVFEPLFAFLGGAALFVILAAGVLLGYVARKEARGERVFWAEWPVPEGRTYAPAGSEEVRKAA